MTKDKTNIEEINIIQERIKEYLNNFGKYCDAPITYYSGLAGYLNAKEDLEQLVNVARHKSWLDGYEKGVLSEKEKTKDQVQKAVEEAVRGFKEQLLKNNTVKVHLFGGRKPFYGYESSQLTEANKRWINKEFENYLQSLDKGDTDRG